LQLKSSKELQIKTAKNQGYRSKIVEAAIAVAATGDSTQLAQLQKKH
jgi:hypothetical protein